MYDDVPCQQMPRTWLSDYTECSFSETCSRTYARMHRLRRSGPQWRSTISCVSHEGVPFFHSINRRWRRKGVIGSTERKASGLSLKTCQSKRFYAVSPQTWPQEVHPGPTRLSVRPSVRLHPDPLVPAGTHESISSPSSLLYESRNFCRSYFHLMRKRAAIHPASVLPT